MLALCFSGCAIEAAPESPEAAANAPSSLVAPAPTEAEASPASLPIPSLNVAPPTVLHPKSTPPIGPEGNDEGPRPHPWHPTDQTQQSPTQPSQNDGK